MSDFMKWLYAHYIRPQLDAAPPDDYEMPLSLLEGELTSEMAADYEKAREFTASVGGGVVEAKVNGKKEVLALTIKPEAVDPEDVEMLQDLVVSAVNEALRQAGEAMDKSIEQATGGLDLGAFGL